MFDLMSRLAACAQQEMVAEEGQTMVEYGLILALVSVVAIAILGTLGGNVIATFGTVAAAL